MRWCYFHNPPERSETCTTNRYANRIQKLTQELTKTATGGVIQKRCSKETPMFSCEFCKILRTVFAEHLRTIASDFEASMESQLNCY